MKQYAKKDAVGNECHSFRPVRRRCLGSLFRSDVRHTSRSRRTRRVRGDLGRPPASGRTRALRFESASSAPVDGGCAPRDTPVHGVASETEIGIHTPEYRGKKMCPPSATPIRPAPTWTRSALGAVPPSHPHRESVGTSAPRARNPVDNVLGTAPLRYRTDTHPRHLSPLATP